MVTLTFIEIILLIMAVISITVGILALVFGWIFYKNSQKINQDTRDSLSKISEKIEKIDDIVSKQFDKLISKAVGIDYEGAIPISELQFIKKIEKRRSKRKLKRKK